MSEMNTVNGPDIRDVAAKFLAFRSHTIAEMRKFLKQKDFDEEAIDALIEDFVEYGYLDDERYARDYFAYALSKGKGKRVIFSELKEKGVDHDIIQFAFEDLEDGYDEKGQAWEEARKVLRSAGVEFDFDEEICEESKARIDEKLIAKTARRLQSKGYSSDIIYSVIGALRR